MSSIFFLGIRLLPILFFTYSFGLATNWPCAEIVKLKILKEVILSPDQRLALVVVAEARDHYYDTKIYKIALPSQHCQLLTEQSAKQPRFSPDGKKITYLGLSKGQKILYLMNVEDGKSIPLVEGQDIQTFRWSPNSQQIAFVGSTPSKNSSSVINRLWIVDLKTDEAPYSLTNDSYCVRGMGDFGNINEEFDWSPNHQSIVFAYSPSERFDDFYTTSHLALVDLPSKQIKDLKKVAQHESMPRFSPDGKQICFLTNASSHLYAFHQAVLIRSLDDQEIKVLPKTPNEGAFLTGPNLLGWNLESSAIFFYEPYHTQFQIFCLPLDRTLIKPLLKTDLLIHEPFLSSDRQTFAYIGQNSYLPPEVYITHFPSLETTQISHFNQNFLDKPVGKTEKISWQTSDKLTIEGLLTYPLDYQKGKQYPLLLIIHGGPMSFFEQSYLGTPSPYPLSTFSEEGFMILRANPRGSCGYGKQFRCLNYGDWGGKDFEDLMLGLDYLIEQGLVDQNKLGVMGWSYGGYLTSWSITQTNRFKAASVGAAITHLPNMYNSTDLPSFIKDYLGSWKPNFLLYEQRSPMAYIQKIHTPCLIQHGSCDKRVPPKQAVDYYHALKKEGKTATLFLYPNMEHGCTNPSQQIELMQQNLDWFKTYLMH
jgi:dipeptidyl aminopeptidase/acylaminoacyl peptidase